jgi:two-component system, OmpR family, phosphate regulon sensor histidine kinase PhoR
VKEADAQRLVAPSFEDKVRELQAENAALKTELEATQKTTSQYLQNVAHQLTAPLNAIKWSIEAIKDPKVTIPRKMRLLSSIYSQGTILVHLIKNFSLMSNLEADHELGQFREKPERVDPFRLAINLANDFQPQAAEGAKTIVVDELSFNGVLGNKSLLAVKNLIAQALSNLLENAVKYADFKTTIEVEAVSVQVVANAKPSFGIAVRSLGLAISGDEVKSLIQRGFRGTAAKQRTPAGTGIGLYIASRIMEIHQGTIFIQAKGKESSFTLVFPDSRIK